MSMKVIGKEAVDYVSRKTNQPVKGITLYCTEPREGVTVWLWKGFLFLPVLPCMVTAWLFRWILI